MVYKGSEGYTPIPNTVSRGLDQEKVSGLEGSGFELDCGETGEEPNT